MTDLSLRLDDAVERFVDAFESELAKVGTADITHFLPGVEEPEYAAVLHELIRVEMDHRATAGEQVRVDEYRERFPQLVRSAESMDLLLYEEYRLRRQTGEDISPADYKRQYEIDVSSWAIASGVAQVEVAEASRTSSRRDVNCIAPFEPGQEVLDFQIVGSLGTGAFSRVYLARQRSMANRRVVLKVSTQQMCEADRLARLQHTNIVPVYSVHNLNNDSLLCMPYFGSCTLQQILQSDGSGGSRIQSAAALVSTVATVEESTLVRIGEDAQRSGRDHCKSGDNDLQASVPENTNHPSAFDQEFTALWIARQLAVGLDHAHQRGILHRDLKPANILLTEVGQPMILDFNLAADRQPDSAGGRADVVGGTLLYMSPEQLQSLEDFRRIGPQSDIYALGVLLFLMLTGRHPVSSRVTQSAERLEAMRNLRERLDAELSMAQPGVVAIIRKCLQFDAADRYQSAAELADDLDRQLCHLPLRFAGNPSIRERLRKWVRRHPRLTSASVVTSAALLLLVVLALGLVSLRHQLLAAEVQRDYGDFMQSLPSTRSSAFAAVFGDQTPKEAIDHVDRQLSLLSLIGEENRGFELLSKSQQTQLRAARAELETLSWAIRDSIDGDLRVSVPASGTAGAKQNLASEMTGEAEPLTTYRQGVDLFLKRDYQAVEQIFRGFCRDAPDNFAAQFVLGLALRAQQRPSEARSVFSACVALNPWDTQAWYQRGVCELESNRPENALQYFSRVIDLEPEMTSAWVSRGIAALRSEHFEQARDDFTAAIRLGFPETRIWFLRAEAYRKLGKAAEAAADDSRGMSLTPTDPRSWVARALRKLKDDPEAALADLRAAENLAPTSHDVLRNLPMVLSEYLHRPQEAAAVLDIAILKYPDDPFVWGGRGILRARSGQHSDAVADAEEMLRRNPEPLAVYQAACILAVCSEDIPEHRTRALRLLANSLQNQPELAQMANADPDLAGLRESVEFRRIVAAATILLSPVPERTPSPD